MEHDISPVIKEEIEKLKLKYEAFSDDLMECEKEGERLKGLSQLIYKDIEENKTKKRDIEISLQRIAENIQQLNLS